MLDTTTPVTARAILFGDAADAAGTIAEALSTGQLAGAAGEALRRLPEQARDVAVREIGSVASWLFSGDLSDVVVAGWRKYSTLVQAARNTAATPGREEVVSIASHRISAAYRPYIELLVDGVRAATVTLDLALELEVAALTAVIQQARITAFESGRCQATASLTVDGIPVAARTADLDLHLAVRLGDGIRLLPDDASGPPFQPCPP